MHTRYIIVKLIKKVICTRVQQRSRDGDKVLIDNFLYYEVMYNSFVRLLQDLQLAEAGMISVQLDREH